jgi:hypothetical protein
MLARIPEDSRRPPRQQGGWITIDRAGRILERAKGIEPSYAAWEAAVLPLNYARVMSEFNQYFYKTSADFGGIKSALSPRPLPALINKRSGCGVFDERKSQTKTTRLSMRLQPLGQPWHPASHGSPE